MATNTDWQRWGQENLMVFGEALGAQALNLAQAWSLSAQAEILRDTLPPQTLPPTTAQPVIATPPQVGTGMESIGKTVIFGVVAIAAIILIINLSKK